MMGGRSDASEYVRGPFVTPGPTPSRSAVANAATVETRKKPVAVRLRLMRMGKKKQPTYRIVAADSRSPRDGRFIEIVGTYDPRREPSAITVDNEKAVDWLKKGAQPSERVQKLLQVSGAWDEFQSSKAKK
jgi:small subunit ribosomal protein S16